MQSDKEPSSGGLSWALAIAGAVVTATIQQRLSSLLLGALLGFLLAQVLHLRGWVRDLHRELHLLRELKREIERPSAPSAAEAVTRPLAPPAPAPAARTQRIATAHDRPIGPAAQEPAAAPKETAQAQAARAPNAPVGPTPLVGWIDTALAWIKGGNSIARVGIVILFFGTAFVAKYAAEHSLFPIELRFIVIALGAFALLIVGWRLRGKRPAYAQLLQGGGIAGLYLTVFAAFKLYQL